MGDEAGRRFKEDNDRRFDRLANADGLWTLFEKQDARNLPWLSLKVVLWKKPGSKRIKWHYWFSWNAAERRASCSNDYARLQAEHPEIHADVLDHLERLEVKAA